MKDNKENILIIPLEKILPNRFQPRIKFSEESILNLADSIKEHGVLQPIIVRSIGDKYEIVAGERRYKATVLSGLKEIPALLFDMNDKDSAEVALIENVQRKDLSPIEEAISYKKILDMGYLTQSDLATKIGVSQSAVANKIRLLNLCDDVQEALLDEKISERHARSLLKIDSDDIQAQMLKRVLSKKLTVRALDDEIKYYQENKKFKDSEEKEVLSESTSEPIIEIKNTSEEVKKLSPKESVEKIKNELIEENELEKTEEDKKETKSDIELGEKSIFEDISEIDEKEEKEEKDMNNNLQNMNEDINYNTLKTANGNQGKFFMNVDDEKEEKKEEEKSIFNFENSNNSGNIFTDLMAPQGSKNLFRPGTTQESIIPVSTDEPKIEEKVEEKKTDTQNVSSMFENLMGVSTSSNQEIDKESFDKFMDPAFVDGEKQETIENSNINSNVFSKFLVNNEEKEEEKKEEPKPNSGFASSIFGNLFNKEESKEETVKEEPKVEEKKEEAIVNAGTTAPSIFSAISTPVEETKVEEEPKKEEIKPEEPAKEEKVEETEAVEFTSTEDSNSDIFKNNNSNKPDLLAPMGDVDPTTPIQLDNVSNDIFASSNDSTFNNDLSNLSPINPVEEEKEETVVESTDLTSLSGIDSATLTEDTTVEETKTDEVKEEEKKEETTEDNNEDLVSFNTTKPIFVTASSNDTVSSMPTSPIIDVPEETTEEEVVEIPQQAPVVTNIEIEEPDDEVESDINNMIGNQPIIVTDYNKQYDPILPNADQQVEKIDFKKILSLIRELSETIEKCGYEIDTDEIDLQDKYQVIFNINKQ